MTANHRISVELSDTPETAVPTPFGLFELVRMAYGLKNAPQSFLRIVDEDTRGLPLIFVYLDDIPDASRTDERHKGYLRLLYQRLDEHGPVLKPDKRIFRAAAMDFLGRRISSQCIKALKSRVRAL